MASVALARLADQFVFGLGRTIASLVRLSAAHRPIGAAVEGLCFRPIHHDSVVLDRDDRVLANRREAKCAGSDYRRRGDAAGPHGPCTGLGAIGVVGAQLRSPGFPKATEKAYPEGRTA